MEQNMDRHIYLYAKNHYKRTDVILDLKKIHGLMYGIKATEVDTEAVIRNLIRLTFPHLKDDVSEFLLDISPEDCWKVNAPCREQKQERTHNQYTYSEAIIRKCLSILQLTDLKNIPFELGKPDPTIFPLSKRDTW